MSGSNVWLGCMVQMSCPNVWLKRMTQIYGSNVWSKCLAQMAGPNVWLKCMAQVYDPNIWLKLTCMTQVYDPNGWFNSRAQMDDSKVSLKNTTYLSGPNVRFACMTQMYGSALCYGCIIVVYDSELSRHRGVDNRISFLDSGVWLRRIMQACKGLIMI